MKTFRVDFPCSLLSTLFMKFRKKNQDSSKIGLQSNKILHATKRGNYKLQFETENGKVPKSTVC